MNLKTSLIGFCRTPIGKYLGNFKNTSAVVLASECVSHLVAQYNLTDSCIDQMYLGNVLAAGIGQHPARQVAFNSGLSNKINTLNINKVCGSGMMSVALAHEHLLHHPDQVVLAGGMENMSMAPYLIRRNIEPNKLKSLKTEDHLLFDGLTSHSKIMGKIAEEARGNLTRSDQDDYTKKSYERYLEAKQQSIIDESIIEVNIGKKTVSDDECPGDFNIEKIEQLRPVFDQNGTITAANASALADGASMCLLTSSNNTDFKDPLAWILDFVSVGTTPENFMSAPAIAVEKLLKKINWKKSDVDLFEINEAFALTVLLNMADLNIDFEKTNIFGGACIMGHPLGMSGNRIIGQLYHALKIKGLHRGIAAICIGGGEAIALAMEVVN